MRKKDITSINWQEKLLTITNQQYKFTAVTRSINGLRYVYAHSRINGKVENICLGKAGEKWRDGTILMGN